MKVKELIIRLQQLDPEAVVRIPVTSTSYPYGSTTSVDIDSVGAGIDWDISIVHVYTKSPLVHFMPNQYENFMNELFAANKARDVAFKKGIKDAKIVEINMNPIFKTGV